MLKEVGEEGKGNGWAAPQKESSDTGSLVLRLLSLLQAGILGEVSGEGLSRTSISSPGAPFPRRGLPWSVPGQGAIITAAGPGVAHLVLLLFWAWSCNMGEA